MNTDSKTQTPRTDEAFAKLSGSRTVDQYADVVPFQFACTLELELSAAIKERDGWKRRAEEFLATIETRAESETEILSELERDRDAWRSLARRLAEVLRRANPECKDFHHEPSERHEWDKECPVDRMFGEAISDFDQMEKGTSPTSAQPPST